MTDKQRSTSRAQRLRCAMSSHQISQAEVASRTGLQRSNLSAMLAGTREVSEQMLSRILVAIEGEAKLPGDVLMDRQAEVRRVVIDHGFTDPHVFGSIARDEDELHSDIDLYATPVGQRSMSDYGTAMGVEQELERLLGIKVDFIPDPDDLSPRVRKMSYAL